MPPARLSWVISGAATVLLLAACGGGGHRPSTTTAGATHHSSGGSATATRPSNVDQVSCQQEITGAQASGGPIRPGPSDLVIGPLSFPNGRHLAHAQPRFYGGHGSYKIPPVLAPGATVTITIAPRARSYVVLSGVGLPHDGSVAATYNGCPHAWGFFPGGFTFTDGRVRGCVPMDITVRGQQPRHVVLSLFAGDCPT